MAEGRQNRRYPQNLQGVLQLAIDAGSGADGPTAIEPISQERSLWLREALADVCKGQMDEVEQMKQCLTVLNKEDVNGEEDRDDDEEDERESAFELLSELCENLDNARDLMVLGGLDVCVAKYLCHAQSGLRWRAAQLIASCAQNMPQVQVHLLKIGALPKLLQLTDSDPHPTVRVKALYAVSCLVREQEAGLEAFLSHDGFSVLMRGMQSEDEKLQTKSAFLLLNLLTSNPEQKDTLISMGMVQQLVSVLRTPHSPFHEHVLGALCCLVEDCEKGLKDCRDPSLNLEELLRLRARELQGKDESQEELEFCERLRMACFRRHQSDDHGMDR
ncbi:hsp70-binding protein 1 [Dunckerocampus dactyliophorus]|uniref:hsp70-binding protein 1 n=1 Tax=Dunckerocampus dactyliophorus TaxID=161453 RepID=UPI002406F10E|nr:hsp70-binding protein 1 [Dunckerocampus dactyliophorus]XP_054615832.1 hsp70-binding protein 1 [Dunckerocampus dactyliophorus]